MLGHTGMELCSSSETHSENLRTTEEFGLEGNFKSQFQTPSLCILVLKAPSKLTLHTVHPQHFSHSELNTNIFSASCACTSFKKVSQQQHPFFPFISIHYFHFPTWNNQGARAGLIWKQQGLAGECQDATLCSRTTPSTKWPRLLPLPFRVAPLLVGKIKKKKMELFSWLLMLLLVYSEVKKPIIE